MKAPLLPHLGMHWLVEVTSEHYGPTTLGAIEEFIRLGEIHEKTFVINACDGTRRQIQEMPALLEAARANSEPAIKETEPNRPGEPAAAGISIRLQERIRDLEQTSREERRALAQSEHRYQELDQKYQELIRRASERSFRRRIAHREWEAA
jgi:hypothetical protein